MQYGSDVSACDLRLGCGRCDVSKLAGERFMRNLVLSTALIVSSAISANAQQAAPDGGSANSSQLYFQKLSAADNAQQAKLQAKLQAAREARQANPLAWAKSLDPLPQGGWKLVYVGGSEAIFATSDQEVREGKYVTIWMRYEFGDSQSTTYSSGDYLSSVEKDQFDCASARERLFSVSWFPENNLQGKPETVEQPRSAAAWYAIIPGSGIEDIWRYVCAKH